MSKIDRELTRINTLLTVIIILLLIGIITGSVGAVVVISRRDYVRNYVYDYQYTDSGATHRFYYRYTEGICYVRKA